MAQLLHRFWNVTFVYCTIHDEIAEATITVCEVDRSRAYCSGLLRARNVCDDFDARFIGIKGAQVDPTREPRLLTVS